MSDHPTPEGVQFFDQASGRQCLLSEDGWTKGWLLWKHPDGQWITWRKATKDDRQRLALIGGLRMRDVVLLDQQETDR